MEKFKQPQENKIQRQIKKKGEPKDYKVITLPNLVPFPNIPIRHDLIDPFNKKTAEKAFEDQEEVVIAYQKNIDISNPTKRGFNVVGVVATIKKLSKSAPFTIKLSAVGTKRVYIENIVKTAPYLVVKAVPVEIVNADTTIAKALFSKAKDMFADLIEKSTKTNPANTEYINSIEDYNSFADSIAAMVVKDKRAKVQILNDFDTETRLEKTISSIAQEIEMAEINERINANVRTNMDKAQKEYYLKEQMKAIGEELGEDQTEYDDFEEKIRTLDLPKEVKDKAQQELKRVKKMPAAAPENSIIRNYLDTLLSLPWNKKTKDNKDIKKAKKILDEDHAGLDDVKERILEHLAVMQLTESIGGQIICLVGPPGVGKTSIGRSIARALNRKFVKMSLGGVKDESELRGHRKTYIGAMAGKIIYNMKLANHSNPVFLIDEIDKMASDYKGDPASAMLEVLDPEQNIQFRDHFIEVPYDLSNVLFIATANSASDIPAPLLDRMEVINLSSYTTSEKLDIAKNYLFKKACEKHGIDVKQIEISDAAFEKIIEEYTFEAGVRNLERQISKICRKIAVKILEDDENKVFKLTKNNLFDYLGSHLTVKDAKRESPDVGLVTGLSYSSIGGGILNIEANLTKGKGKIILTGSLGDVMKESAKAAISAVKNISDKFNIPLEEFVKKDIHIHCPEGAVKKEGPSAGVAMATAILSAFTNKLIDNNIAMTGEITIRGKVLPIGGVKEKIYAAKRAGIGKVLIPKKNSEDVKGLKDEVKKGVEIIEVETLTDVVSHAIIK